MKLLSVFISALFILFATPRAVEAKITFSPIERKIIQWTDERRNADSIALYLSHKDEKVAWRAAWGLANIEDSTSRPKLIAALSKETRSTVINGIAFALGVLGGSKQSYSALMSAAQKQPTEDAFRAIGRTVPKDELPSFASALAKMLETSKVREATASLALLEIGIRKLMTDDLLKLAAKLSTSNDARARWQSIYSFSRTEDSALLVKYIPALAEALNDQGSSETRMFAATALGRMHDDSAAKLLIRAARSEGEWRVKVTLFNALAKLPRFNSVIFDIIRRTVDATVSEAPLSEHVAASALSALDAMVAAGKLAQSDSLTVKDWLDSYRTERELFPQLPIRIRAQAMVTLSRLDHSIDSYRGITDIYTSRNKGANAIVTQGLGVAKDTLYFKQLLMRVIQSPEHEIFANLEAMNASWKLALKDSNYMAQLDQEKLSGAYRNLIIRLPSQFADASIVTTALEHMQDSSIVIDSNFREEAIKYTNQYLTRFSTREFSDHIISTLQAVKWLRPQSQETITSIRSIYIKASTQWSDKPLADSARSTLLTLGTDVEKVLQVVPRKSTIDWDMLENSSDTMLVQYAPEFIFIQLDKYNAPLTCASMIQLIKGNFFAQNQFHRVVPNFVIQAGDPTGTGFGGPGYTIRREVSNIYYDEPGVIGMASSGKDTEGSQWFATHLPTPHLNSRYTIWGKIVEGFKALNSIQRYDKMDNIIPYQY